MRLIRRIVGIAKKKLGKTHPPPITRLNNIVTSKSGHFIRQASLSAFLIVINCPEAISLTAIVRLPLSHANATSHRKIKNESKTIGNNKSEKLGFSASKMAMRKNM